MLSSCILVGAFAASLALLVTSGAPKQILPSDQIPEYLANYGIEVQTHTIITDDGYILSAFRLPRQGAPVVLFQHGILSSAWCWISNEPSLSPALQAYYSGYDVWLTNSRGNMFSRRHLKMQPFLDKKFWDFSFGEMGKSDVPSNIKYILSTTGQAMLSFVGHSQGTSQFFAAMTDPKTRPYIEQTVNLFVALSPVTYMANQRSLLLKEVSRFHLGDLLEATFPFGFLDFDSIGVVSTFLCKATSGAVCSITVDVVCGTSKYDVPAAIANISAFFPDGTSVKGLDHFEQLIDSTEFRDYDYGAQENMKRYGSATPPAFNLSTARVPTAFFLGTHDDLADPTDANRAAAQLPASTLRFKEAFDDFSHATWIAGSPESFQMWFPKLQGLLKEFNPTAGRPSAQATVATVVI